MKTMLLLLPLAILVEKSPPTRSTDTPVLVWDLSPDVATKGFRNFRMEPGTRESGSSEFSADGLKKILSQLPGHVVVFDLRQEDHGFINGQPVSWYAVNNWANVGKSHAEIVHDERAKLAALAPGSPVTLTDDSVKKKGATDAPTKTEVVVKTETEGQLVRASGASYVRLTVSDHSRPKDEEVDRFIAAVRKLPPDAWTLFHCRAGRGRTTTFMALYDMLRTADHDSLQTIVDRQSDLAVDYNLLSKADEKGANAGEAVDRAAFVRAFYNYAKANPGGEPQTWTEWLKTQS